MFDIRLFDTYSDRFYFTIDKSEKFKTIIGGFFGILSFVIIIGMSFFLGRSFYFKFDPKILEQKKDLPNHIIREIDPYDITIAFKIENYNSLPIHFENILFFNVFFKTWKKNEKGYYVLNENKKLNYYKCNDTRFDHITVNKIDRNQWNCIEIDGVNDLFLGGKRHESDSEQTIDLSISNCPTETFNKNDCTLFQQLGVKSPYITILHPFVDFNYDLYDPLTKLYKSIYNTLDPNIYNSYTCDYNYGNFTDDQGIITQSLQTQEFIYIDKCIMDVNLIEKGLEEIARVIYWSKSIFLSKTISQNKRSYMKIQDLLAVLGGFMSIIKIIFRNIYNFFFIFERKKFLINKIWLENEKTEIELKNLNNNLKINFNLSNYQVERSTLKKKKHERSFIIKKCLNNQNSTKFDSEKFKLRNNKNSKIEDSFNEIDKYNRNYIFSNQIEINDDFSKRKLDVDNTFIKSPDVNHNKIIDSKEEGNKGNQLDGKFNIDKKNLFSTGFLFLQEYFNEKHSLKSIRNDFINNYGFCKHLFRIIFNKKNHDKKDYFDKIMCYYEDILQEPYDAYNYFKFYYNINYNFE